MAMPLPASLIRNRARRGGPARYGADGRVSSSWAIPWRGMVMYPAVAGPGHVRAIGSSSAGPSFPARNTPCLLDPTPHLRSFRLLQGLHLHVTCSIGGPEWRWRVESRAAEEDEVNGDVVGDHLDDPSVFGQPVIRLLPLDRVSEPSDRRADRGVQPLDDGMQIGHHAPHPNLDVVVTLGWHGRPPTRKRLGCSLHRTRSSVAKRIRNRPPIRAEAGSCEGLPT